MKSELFPVFCVDSRVGSRVMRASLCLIIGGVKSIDMVCPDALLSPQLTLRLDSLLILFWEKNTQFPFHKGVR